MNRYYIFLWSFFFLGACGTPRSEEKKEVEREEVLTQYPNQQVKSKEIYYQGMDFAQGYEEFYPSGKIKIRGTYNSKKERHGKWVAFYENGNIWSEGEYDMGVEHGVKKVYYETGELRYQGKMTAGKPVGTWKFYDLKGIMTEKKYPNQ